MGNISSKTEKPLVKISKNNVDLTQFKRPITVPTIRATTVPLMLPPPQIDAFLLKCSLFGIPHRGFNNKNLQTESPLSKLSLDLLLLVFKYLDVKALSRFLLTCQYFCEAGNNRQVKAKLLAEKECQVFGV